MIPPLRCYWMDIPSFGVQPDAICSRNDLPGDINIRQVPHFFDVIGVNREQQFVVFSPAERTGNGIELEFERQKLCFGMYGNAAFFDEGTDAGLRTDMKKF